MLIDFKEIADDHAFENFCMQLINSMGLTIPVAPAIGPDGGRDIVCEQPSHFDHVIGYRWLASCKHFAKSGASVGVKHDAAIPHKLAEHGCNGFMFFFSTAFTEGFRTSVDKVCNQIRSQYKIFNSYDIENILLSSPRFYPLIRQYFPISHGKIITFQNTQTCCEQETSQDALYVVYTKDNLNVVSETVLGECCINTYIDHLEDNSVEYGVSQIRSSTEW